MSVSIAPAGAARRGPIQDAARTIPRDGRVPVEDELVHWASWLAAREVPHDHAAEAAAQRYRLADCLNCGQQFVTLVSVCSEDECFVTTCSVCGQAVRF
jgi:hypothetical protein